MRIVLLVASVLEVILLAFLMWSHHGLSLKVFIDVIMISLAVTYVVFVISALLSLSQRISELSKKLISYCILLGPLSPVLWIAAMQVSFTSNSESVKIIVFILVFCTIPVVCSYLLFHKRKNAKANDLLSYPAILIITGLQPLCYIPNMLWAMASLRIVPSFVVTSALLLAVASFGIIATVRNRAKGMPIVAAYISSSALVLGLFISKWAVVSVVSAFH